MQVLNEHLIAGGGLLYGLLETSSFIASMR